MFCESVLGLLVGGHYDPSWSSVTDDDDDDVANDLFRANTLILKSPMGLLF